MCLHPESISPVPETTARVAKAAFPKGNRYMRLRDELGVFYNDEDFAKRSAYAQIVVRRLERIRVRGKETGKTNYIERFNCTLRQRISRLVRKTLSFSKKVENHIGAIWYFIHHYNTSLPL